MANNTLRPPAVIFHQMRIAPRRASRPCGMARLICVLILAAGPVLAVHAGVASLTLSIDTWNAGTEGAGNISSPGLDFTPSTITEVGTYTAQFDSAANSMNNTTYYFRVNKNADETTTWNPYFVVEICPVSRTGDGRNFVWTVPLGTWVTVSSSEEKEIYSFVLSKKQTETITFQIRISSITTGAGPRSPFTTTINYRVY